MPSIRRRSGLGDFGKPTGYLERQVRRWGSQWELVQRDERPASTPMSGDCIPRSQKRFRRRAAHRSCTATTASTTRFSTRKTPPRCVAVLDWEMSTLGDPISDAALMCVYRHPLFNVIHASSAWASPLMPEADDLAHRYSLAAEQSLDNWDFYMALGYFKVAIIAAGIAFRARMGGGVAVDTDQVDQAVGPADGRGAQRAGAVGSARGLLSGSSSRLGEVGRSVRCRPLPSTRHRIRQRTESPRPPASPIPIRRSGWWSNRCSAK